MRGNIPAILLNIKTLIMYNPYVRIKHPFSGHYAPSTLPPHHITHKTDFSVFKKERWEKQDVKFEKKKHGKTKHHKFIKIFP